MGIGTVESEVKRAQNKYGGEEVTEEEVRRSVT